MSVSAGEFRRLMYCGHGRAFSAMEKGNPEIYRNAVLFGCLHDIAYDMQCEGSRGIFMYNLVQYYPDPDFFAMAAIDTFRKLPLDMNEHRFQHLCDLLIEFAADGNAAVLSALDEKYTLLHNSILRSRNNRKQNRMLTNFEYLCILFMQNGDNAHFLKIVSDMGIYYNHHELGWFLSVLKQDEQKMYYLESLCQSGEASCAVRAFMKLLDAEEAAKNPPHPKEPLPTAEEILHLAETGTLTLAHRRRFSLRKDPAEAEILAETANSVIDPVIRARLWMMFDTRYNPYPLSPDLLLADAVADHEDLWSAARSALCHVQHPAVRTFAKQLLAEKPLCTDAVLMLIANCQPEDTMQLLEILRTLSIDKNEKSGWHAVIMTILDHAEKMPDEALLFIYEKSRCSCCRESALFHMQKRNMLTPEILWECAHDCNSDIREAYGNIE